ncbi:MAG: 50S ribosomal protein L6 [Oligoflexia bacterium]|nr:50S ribosomal protein L6 [Oligoflexia bacterium]
MSRIGKQTIQIADKVTVQVIENRISVKGPKGELHREIDPLLRIKSTPKELNIEVSESVDQKEKRNVASLWGLTRTLVSNMISGVSVGFSKSLDFTGVGYKAAVSGDVLSLSLGFSHPVEYKVPKGISITVKANKIEITGVDKELVGFVAAKIRDIRPPEPYKGKGIRYSDEVIIRKAGKTGGKQS